jgi:hypothetical protein
LVHVNLTPLHHLIKRKRRPSRVWAAAACVLSKKDHCRALNAFCLCAFHNHAAVVGQVQIHRIVSGGGVVRLDGVGRTVVRVDGLLDELFCPLRR